MHLKLPLLSSVLYFNYAKVKFQQENEMIFLAVTSYGAMNAVQYILEVLFIILYKLDESLLMILVCK